MFSKTRLKMETGQDVAGAQDFAVHQQHPLARFC